MDKTLFGYLLLASFLAIASGNTINVFLSLFQNFVKSVDRLFIDKGWL